MDAIRREPFLSVLIVNAVFADCSLDCGLGVGPKKTALSPLLAPLAPVFSWQTDPLAARLTRIPSRQPFFRTFRKDNQFGSARCKTRKSARPLRKSRRTGVT
jgi:hypothetical protein